VVRDVCLHRDVYDAVTSVRPYKQAWNPGEALRHMAQWKGHFDIPVFQAFVKTVGIYPVGGPASRRRSGRSRTSTCCGTAARCADDPAQKR